MGTEIHVLPEGSLWWVQASGVGLTWATATGPASGQFGYVDSFNFTSAITVNTQSDRGIPQHHKFGGRQPIQGSLSFRWTGRHPSALSGSGASMPMIHLEFRASAPEVGNGTTGDYFQFMGVAVNSLRFNEAMDGDTIQMDFVALAMLGPTGSGYVK